MFDVERLRTLVLLPGMDGTGQLFAPFIAALGKDIEMQVIRYPGCSSWGYSELVSFARAALPADRPFVLLGESFSGPIAISPAASDIPQLKGLVLCCTFAQNPRPAFAALRPLVRILPVAAVPAAVLRWFLMGRFAATPLRLALTKALAQVSPATFRARLAAVLSVDVRAQLAATRVPALYLQAALDRVVPLAAIQLVAKLKPGMQVAQFPAPHFLLQAAPAEAARAITTFMQEVARPSDLAALISRSSPS